MRYSACLALFLIASTVHADPEWQNDTLISSQATGLGSLTIDARPDGSAYFAHVSGDASGEQVGWYRSTDSGQTWANFLSSVWAINNASIGGAYGFNVLVQVWQAFGNIFRRTVDATTGAQIGQSVIVNESPLVALNIVVDSNAENGPPGAEDFIAAIVFHNPTNQQSSLKVYHSTDHGATWPNQFTLDTGPLNTPNAIGDVHLCFARAGYPFFHIVYWKQGNLWAVRSTNAGISWGAPQNLFAVSSNSAVSVAAFGIFATAVGESPTGEVVYKNTNDAGVTWSALKTIDAAQAGGRFPYIAFRGFYQVLYWTDGGLLATRATTTPDNQGSWSAEEPANLFPTAYQPWAVGHGTTIGATYIRYDDDDRPYFISFPSATNGVDEPAASAPPPAKLSVFPLPAAGRVTLAWSQGQPAGGEIVDALGRQVAPLTGWTAEGSGASTAWEGLDTQGRPVAAGVYFARVPTASGLATQRIVIVR